MTLVDSNILFDLLTRDPTWSAWSLAQLDAASVGGPLLINDIIYAELAARYESIERLDGFVGETGLEIAPMPRQALFLAARAHNRYRALGGTRTGVLPDFFIGAQAMVSGYELITRDAARYRTHFPNVRLISPQTN